MLHVKDTQNAKLGAVRAEEVLCIPFQNFN